MANAICARVIYGCNLMQIHFKFYLNAIIYNRNEHEHDTHDTFSLQC